MSYFVSSISVKNEELNLETRISIFSVTLTRKSENQAEVFRLGNGHTRIVFGNFKRNRQLF